MWKIDPARLAEAMKAAGVNQSELAARVGMKQPSIGRLLTGETKTTRAIFVIARELKTSPAYLSGVAENEMFDGQSPLPAEAEPLIEAAQASTVMIPQLDIGYSMGGGSVFEEYAQTALIPFPREWLRPMIGGTFGDLFVARGEGDSMMPTLLDSDFVIIDTAQKTIVKQDRLWCLNYGDLGMIKRVRMQPDGGALIISDNPAVENFTAYDGEVQTIGRVIWIGRRV